MHSRTMDEMHVGGNDCAREEMEKRTDRRTKPPFFDKIPEKKSYVRPNDTMWILTTNCPCPKTG
jgi:hypothetical protein